MMRSETLRVMLDETALGNRFAFSCLYDELATETYIFCLRIVGTHGPADQAVVETWLRVWQHAASLIRAPSPPARQFLPFSLTSVNGSSRMGKSMTVGSARGLGSVERSPRCWL